MKRIVHIVIAFVFSFSSLFGQENQGAIHDNWNPVNGQYMNPSNIVDAKPYLDINFLGFSAYARNNLAFFDNRSLIGLIGDDEAEVMFDGSKNMINGRFDFDFKGPSASIVLGKNAFSIFTNARAIVNVNNVPGVVGKFLAEEGNVDVFDVGTYEARNMRFKNMLWSEIGVTYGRILFAKGYTMITGAISLKRLFGFQQTTFVLRDAEIEVPDLSTVNVNNIDGKYAFADASAKSGRGWGTNIGVTYKKMRDGVDNYVPHSKKGRCKYIEYDYKIGVSLLDLGYINFNESVRFGEFDENSNLDDLQNGSFGDEPASNFLATLPTVVSGQFDYNINDQLFANATLIQRIPLARLNGVERPNVASVSLRYERRYFGVGLPVTLVNYKNPQVGLGLRLANLTIGSDNLLPIFMKHNKLRAVDFYFSLKHTIRTCKDCRPKKSKRGSRKKSNTIDCPAF